MSFTLPVVDISDETIAAVKATISDRQQTTIASATDNNSIPRDFKVFCLVTTGFSAVKDNVLAWAGLTYTQEEPGLVGHYHVRNWYDGTSTDAELDVFEDRLNKTHAKLSQTMFWPYGRTHMDTYGEDKASFDESLRNFLAEPQVLVGHKTRFDIDFVSNYLQQPWSDVHCGGKDNVFDTLSLCKAAFAGLPAPQPTQYAAFAEKMAKEQTVQSCGLFPHVDMVYSLTGRLRPTQPLTQTDKEPVIHKLKAIFALMLTWQKFVGQSPVQ